MTFLATFWIFWVISVSAADIVYPLPVISKPSCRFDNFSTLDSSCKETLPILEPDDYDDLKEDYDLRRIYTVLWTWTYTYGWDVWNWSHLWVDIATSEGTPVVSIADWTVIFAWVKTWRGNVVIIKHEINWKTIYSNYAHLSAINTTYWASVKASDKIWEVWSTWNSTWNHLHFQIDTNSWDSSHPYYYFQNCPWDEWTTVNAWSCISDVRNNTLDPLLFLSTKWAIIKWWEIDVDETIPETISQTDLTTRQEIEEREIKDFLRLYKLKFTYDSPTWNVPLNGTMTIHLTITRKSNWRAFTGNLPDFMNFITNREFVKILPDKLRVISEGKEILY